MSRAFCPKPSPTVCATELNVYCCAATRFHRDGGDGRLLAAFDVLAEEERHELPQKQRRAPDEHARFRNNTTTLMRTTGTNGDDLVRDQQVHCEEISRDVVRRYGVEGAHRPCEGGPERHLLRH